MFANQRTVFKPDFNIVLRFKFIHIFITKQSTFIWYESTACDHHERNLYG